MVFAVRFGAFLAAYGLGPHAQPVVLRHAAGPGGILYTVQTDLHSYFVSNRLGAVAYAIYGVGIVQLPLMTMLQEATNAVVIPRVSAFEQQNDKREIIQLMARAMRKLAAVYFPAYALLFVVAHEFIGFFSPGGTFQSMPVFTINLTLLLLAILLQDPLFRAYVEQRFFLIRLRVASWVLLTAGLWFGTTISAWWERFRPSCWWADRTDRDGDPVRAGPRRRTEGYRAAQGCRETGGLRGGYGGTGGGRSQAFAEGRQAVGHFDCLRYRVFAGLSWRRVVDRSPDGGRKKSWSSGRRLCCYGGVRRCPPTPAMSRTGRPLRSSTAAAAGVGLWVTTI